MTNKSLQISIRTAEAGLTLEQQRFNFLIQQIEKVRHSRVEFENLVLKFRQEHAQKLQPLRSSLTGICRDGVFALDRLIDQPGWSRADRAALKELLCETADALLAANGADEQIKALFDKHSTVRFDAAKQDDLQRLKDEAEEMTGLDLGDDEDIRSEDDLIQRMYEEMAAREAADAARESAKSERRRKSAAQKRSEDNARLARESLREIYRKLASALHPDREPDAQRREEKNVLMQKINQAYAANDLLTLFETQMQIEQIDAGHVRKLSAERLKQYNKLLAEQLATVKAGLADLERGFRMDFGLPPTGSLNQQKLSQMLRRQAGQLRAEVARQKHILGLFADKAATKLWLKERRRLLADDYFEDSPF